MAGAHLLIILCGWQLQIPGARLERLALIVCLAHWHALVAIVLASLQLPLALLRIKG